MAGEQNVSPPPIRLCTFDRTVQVVIAITQIILVCFALVWAVQKYERCVSPGGGYCIQYERMKMNRPAPL